MYRNLLFSLITATFLLPTTSHAGGGRTKQVKAKPASAQVRAKKASSSKIGPKVGMARTTLRQRATPTRSEGSADPVQIVRLRGQVSAISQELASAKPADRQALPGVGLVHEAAASITRAGREAFQCLVAEGDGVAIIRLRLDAKSGQALPGVDL